MTAPSVLRNHAREAIQLVQFNPQNAFHMEAYLMLTRPDGNRKQHPTLRFQLEQPYLDVVSMMHGKIAHAYVEARFQYDRTLMEMIGKAEGPDPADFPTVRRIGTRKHG